VVGAGAKLAQTVACDAVIGAGAVVGPFAYLDRGSRVEAHAVTGAFAMIGFDDERG
jgi:bifunctional UDP-N-acetylglucosamine pyrophosphorylase/glucosamine-1-phosphate N-acetyltransferase